MTEWRTFWRHDVNSTSWRFFALWRVLTSWQTFLSSWRIFDIMMCILRHDVFFLRHEILCFSSCVRVHMYVCVRACVRNIPARKELAVSTAAIWSAAIYQLHTSNYPRCFLSSISRQTPKIVQLTMEDRMNLLIYTLISSLHALIFAKCVYDWLKCEQNLRTCSRSRLVPK